MSSRPPIFTSPAGYDRIKVVENFHELATTPFGDGINALCWPRSLAGDFDEVVAQLGPMEEITSIDEARLATLRLSAAGWRAAEILLEDQQRLRALGLAPTLDCIPAYPRDDDPGPVAIDVYSFHADSATVPTDTWLCSYTQVASEGLRNEEAQRCIDVPGTRAALLDVFGGSDGTAFRQFLQEHCYDLHYVPLSGGQPFSFGLGNLWRIAVEYPRCPVPPCIHRAPETRPGQPPRLLLIS